MKLFLVALTVSVLFIKFVSAQTDDVGSGRALQFDGTDDYIDLGNIYDNIALPITVSAWVNLDPSVSNWAPIFASQDNAPIYNGFWLIVQPTAISIGYGDGKGENLPDFRRSKSVNVSNISNRWVHITGVLRSAVDMDIYVNGINVGGAYSGFSNFSMSSSSADIAKIGYWYSNSVVHRFKGKMDEVRVWNRPLSQAEIRNLLCKKLTGNENGLIGNWTFNELNGTQINDESSNEFHGEIKFSAQRIYSGAPLGDVSAHLYTPSWTSKEVSLKISNDELKVRNVTGNPDGVHVYGVAERPSQVQGLTENCFDAPYFGVFTDNEFVANSYDLIYSIDAMENNQLGVSARPENSVAQWQSLSGDNSESNIFIVQSQSYRGEYINNENLSVDLGPDVILCDQSSYSINAKIDDPSATYFWNTGELTSSIDVTNSGDYSVLIQAGCGTIKDTIAVDFYFSPSTFDFGPDRELCSGTIELRPYQEIVDHQFTWSDGSHNPFIVVEKADTYWVKAENLCGSYVDSLVVKWVDIDLGPDTILCDQLNYFIDSKIQDPLAAFFWNTGESTSSIDVRSSGVYSVSIEASCGILRDTVSVGFVQSPPNFDFGPDKELCSGTIELYPYPEGDDLQFTWNNGTHEPFLVIDEPGLYWLKVENYCGSFIDSLVVRSISLDSLFFPNIITPNGDPFNQYFELDKRLTGKVALFIYNRWGKEVFFSTNYENDWDGSDLPAGVYYYTLRSPCINELKGSLSIIR